MCSYKEGLEVLLGSELALSLYPRNQQFHMSAKKKFGFEMERRGR